MRGGTCSTHDRHEKLKTSGQKRLREEIFEDFGVDEKIILKWIVRKQGQKASDWIHLSQNRDR
jgi:myosin heavy subunit